MSADGCIDTSIYFVNPEGIWKSLKLGNLRKRHTVLAWKRGRFGRQPGQVQVLPVRASQLVPSPFYKMVQHINLYTRTLLFYIF